MSALHDRVAALARLATSTLAELLPPDAPYALLDCPTYPNPGDSAIWLGQRAALRAIGAPAPAYTCDLLTYDRDALRRAVGRGPILLTGGGSFGDLWPLGQACREDVLRSFPENPVIQLPQSLHFQRADTLRRAAEACRRHSRFTLLVRDARSARIAENELGVAARLCPDMAFCLGPLPRPVPAHEDIVWLARTDAEAATTAHREATIDWIDEPATPLRRAVYLLIGAWRRPALRRLARRLLSVAYDPLARQRLGRAVRTLAAGRVVITDRLHGHVLAMLLGLPHVLLDNSYGKLSSFHAAWTRGLPGVLWADTAEQACAHTAALLAASQTALETLTV